MNLRDLLDDAEEEGDSAGVFRVFLATRTVDGEALERDHVRVMNIGGLRVDPDHEEVGLIPPRATARTSPRSPSRRPGGCSRKAPSWPGSS